MILSHPLVLFVVLCGISLSTVIGQMDVINSFNSNSAGVGSQVVNQEEPGSVPAEDPDDEDDIQVRLGQVDSIEDFMALLTLNGQQVATEDLYEREVDESGKLTIIGGRRMAIPDRCSPRNTTIRITMDEGTDSNMAFFPRCTKIERCGGCCSSPNLECVPRYTERVSLSVLKGRIPYPGATHLVYSGFATVIVDRHMDCLISCKLSAESCGPLKDFSSRKCTCKCKNRLSCPPPTSWDEDECRCKCQHVYNCCDEPNCGMVWSSEVCDCVNNDGRIVIAANISSSNQRAPGASATPTTTTTTTIATTPTTTSTTPVDPCISHACPPRFTKVRNGDECSCMPPSSNPRSRNGRRYRG